jgi:hypothetical protein
MDETAHLLMSKARRGHHLPLVRRKLLERRRRLEQELQLALALKSALLGQIAISRRERP